MPETVKRWPAVVIGGGLAGSAAALKLARNGREVLLLEKEPSAHDKVCGEFISAEAQRTLRELNIDLTALGAEPIATIRLVKGQRTVLAPLPQAAFSLSRRALDEAVLLAAQTHGARIWRGAAVTNAIKQAQGWQIEIAGRDTIQAETIFLATGKHDLRGWPRPVGTQNDFIGFKLHYRLSPQQRSVLAGNVEMILFDGGYAGLEPVEDGKANLCLVVTKRHFAKSGKNWAGLLNVIVKATPLLAERLAEAEPCWPRPLSVFGIPYGFVYHAGPEAPAGLYRLGDQMAVIPSFSGNGMAIALHTALLAAECHIASDEGVYHRRARKEIQPLVRSASLLSKPVEFPLAQQAIMLACRIRPELITAIAAHNIVSKFGRSFANPRADRDKAGGP